jgi:pimeloyl-ACP methyl ester carboxylesterase
VEGAPPVIYKYDPVAKAKTELFDVGRLRSSLAQARGHEPASGGLPFNVKLWMGAPAENQNAYDFASNLRIAGNLRGHLLLIHGTSDVNAPLAAAIQMIDALVRAGKPYDLVLIPEQDHLVGSSPYGMQAIKRYLVEHLRP